MTLPRLSQRQKAGLAVALALLMWAPQGLSHGDHTVVTGHSTFYNGDVYDPCLGSIAGIMRSRVMWFNNQVLVERYGGPGTYIYVTEYGAPDPRGQKLYTEGVFYDFVDPNGAHWHIEEYFYDLEGGYRPDVGWDDDFNVRANNMTRLYEDRTYVWVVELAPRPIYDQFAGDDPHTYYNFLTLVDTCKMHRSWSQGDNATHDAASGVLNDRNGHENGADPHEHETFFVNIWVGKRPLTVVPYGASTDGAEWQTEWAHQTAGGEASEASGGASQEVTG